MRSTWSLPKKSQVTIWSPNNQRSQIGSPTLTWPTGPSIVVICRHTSRVVKFSLDVETIINLASKCETDSDNVLTTFALHFAMDKVFR